MSKCQDCPVAEGEPCLAVESPERFGHFCRPDWRSTTHDPARVIVGRSRLGLDPAGPSLAQKAVNFAGAVAGHVAAGMPEVTIAQRDGRLAICRSNQCGLYVEGGTCKHTKCGCNLAEKARWADQACPLGLWTAVPTALPAAPTEPCSTAS
jgi:hypothetical protein